ncbi:hypothetical protein L7F22_055553 [Adiantum nelumboides]|nr:hypothetical protein [Adiantum nelumboides]
MALRRSAAGLFRNANRAMVYMGTQHHYWPYELDYHLHAHSYSRDGSQGHHFFFSMFPGPHLGLAHLSTQAAPSSEDPMELYNEKGPAVAAAAAPALSHAETRKLLKLVKVDDFKKLLLGTGNHCMPVDEVLKLCKKAGAATTDAEAEEVTRNLDEAGVILLFRNRVFLEPDKVAELLAKTMPFHLASEDDPRVEELAQLQKEKEEIDRLAHRQVRNMLWGALGAFTLQSVVFFRLTFWDLSWDVMEPITFFVTSSSLLAGFFFFVLTHRDPSYQDLMKTLLSNKQEKLMKKRHFNVERLKELQVQCCVPSHENQMHARH